MEVSMKLVRILVPALLVTMLASGCLVSGRVGVSASARPDLVLVEPGVYVIQDYDEPVFYSEGSYWWYSGGVWYSSHVHTGGWVRVHRTPIAIGRIHRPHTYVRWRAGGNAHGRVESRPASRDHRTGHVRPASRGRVEVRDHRDSRPKNVKVKGKVKVKTKGNRDHRGR
jgi:hypothetical protein